MAATESAPIHKMSFAELMDEEYARKLHEEEHIRISEALAIERFLEDDSIDSTDSQEEENIVEQNDNDQTHLENVSMTDEELARKLAEEEDYLSALHLQQQMESEQYAYELHRRFHNPQYTDANVGIMYGDETRDSFHEADDEQDEETPNPIKVAAASKKKKGSLTSPTKHDPVASSIYNAKNIDKFIDSTMAEKNIRLPTKVYNSLKEHSRQVENNRIRFRSKEDHASYEGALDPRTRLMLYKMLNTGVLDEIHGVVSTGKEANVYHAVGPDMTQDPSTDPKAKIQAAAEATSKMEYAIKVFKTTLNEFKNRQEYIEGEWRFRYDKFSHQNPRKLIKLWAQKEMRNLRRMDDAGIRCPKPVLLKDHVLVMVFLGYHGVPAPTLTQVAAGTFQVDSVCREVIKMMRQLYQSAGLIHADLSPYNILYFDGMPYFIDVSQAVENDHPSALDFLRRDCENISKFFRSKGAEFCMSTRQLFNFVTDKSIDETKLDEYILDAENKNSLHPTLTNEELIEEGVFRNAFIPRTLAQVTHPLQEIELLYNNTNDMNDLNNDKLLDIFHSSVTGMRLPIDDPENLEEDPNTTEEDDE